MVALFDRQNTEKLVLQYLNKAQSLGYEPKVAFVYDGGEAWYRNSVIRDRIFPADGYLEFMATYDTFFHLGETCGIYAVMYDNSLKIPENSVPPKVMIYQKNQDRDVHEEFIADFGKFDTFRRTLVEYWKNRTKYL